MLKRWGDYLSSPQFFFALIAGIFSLGALYDSFTSARADLTRHGDRITALEKDQHRLVRVEQRVEDLASFFGVPKRP